MKIEPCQIVCPDTSDRILPPEEQLATEAATVAGMQLVMLEGLHKRAEALCSRAFEAALYVTSEAAAVIGSPLTGLAVDRSNETLQLAQEMERLAKEMVDQIKPLALSVMAKNESSIRSKAAHRSTH